MILLLIFLSLWLGLALSSAYIGISIAALVFLFFVLKRIRYKVCLVCSFSFLLGFSISFIHIIPAPRDSYKGFVYAAKDNYFLFNSGGERLYVGLKNHSYDIGDFLTIEGRREEISFSTIESSFDFENYLNKKGVFHAIEAKKVTYDFRNPIRINDRREKLLSHFNQEQRSVIGAILFSDGGDSVLSTNLKDLHLARFLSASGIFIGAFYKFFKSILSRCMKDKYADATSIGILSLYTIFTFPRFSILKMMLFLIARWINSYVFNKKYSYLSILAFIGIVSLILNRYLARQDSFILGFLIPLVYYLSRNVYRSHKVKKWFVRYLIIYLFFLPFEIFYYNKIVIMSLPLQVLLSPFFILVAVVSLLCFFYVPLYPVIGFLVNVLSWIAGILEPLSFGVNSPCLNEVMVSIYYFMYVAWLYYLSKRFVPMHRFFLTCQISILLLNALPINNLISDEVDFVNVGQGDCTLIRNHNKTVLIDTGGLAYMDVANESLVPFLRKKRIYKIDAVLITHYDTDHYGALNDLAKSYDVRQVLDYTSDFPLNIGNLTFNNLNYYASSEDENEKSLVLSFNVCHKDIIVMGDATSYIEKEIIKNRSGIKCDILKVGHHGSNTSTCEEWIKYLSPKEAIISCGKNNKYGHPNKEVISVLNKYKIKIRRTDIEGTISYRSIFV